MFYEPHLPSVNKLILNWLEIEIRYCKNKIKHKVSNQSIIEFSQRTKFKTSLSVPKLLCIFRSFRESAVITNVSLQEMLRAINESFETIGTEEISVKSMNNKYHALDQSTKLETKRILNEVVKNIS
jgi:hypothetical protein